MQALPYYLAIGMPYELFWNGEPELVKVYREAHELRNEQRNQEMWVQGIYNYRAFREIMEAFAAGLSGSKSSCASEYPREPIAFTAREQESAAQREKERAERYVQEHQ